MFDNRIIIDGEPHELWDSDEVFENENIVVVSISDDGSPVRGTVAMGPDGIYFTVDDFTFYLDLPNMEKMCDAFSEMSGRMARKVVETLMDFVKENKDVK